MKIQEMTDEELKEFLMLRKDTILAQIAARKEENFHLYKQWEAKATPHQLEAVTKLMKEKYKSFGEVTEAICLGEWAWLYRRPFGKHV